MSIFRKAWDLVREHRLALLIINLAYFGLVALGMIISAVDRSIQERLLASITEGLNEGPLSTILEAYTGGNVISAVILTFLVNFFVASFLQIMLPSLVIPFSGFLLGILRAVMWGFIFSPSLEAVSGSKVVAGILTGVLLLLEGEGYVLALFGSYLHGRAVLWPQTVGAETAGKGYRIGIVNHLLTYIWVALVLLIAAIYEVIIVVFALPGIG